MSADASKQLAEIAARLREVGDRGLTNQFRTAIRAATVPLVQAVHQSAQHRLPQSGGLAAQVAAKKITTVTSLGASRTASVVLRTARKDTLTEQGPVRHPVFADGSKPRSAWTWVTQDIPEAAGWWYIPLKAGSPAVVAALVAIVEKTTAEIAELSA